MKLKTDENELIQEFTNLIKLPLPDLRASLAHKALELKHLFKDEIEDYQKLEKLVDPKSQQENITETGKESVKRLNFDLEKIEGKWTVFPIVHPDVINHILSLEQECEPGIIKMEKINLDGEMIGLGFVKKDENFFTGQIIKKCPEKKTKEAPKQARKEDKKEDLKVLLTYLLNNETFYNYIDKEFKTNWKPLIDTNCVHK